MRQKLEQGAGFFAVFLLRCFLWLVLVITIAVAWPKALPVYLTQLGDGVLTELASAQAPNIDSVGFRRITGNDKVWRYILETHCPDAG